MSASGLDVGFVESGLVSFSGVTTTRVPSGSPEPSGVSSAGFNGPKSCREAYSVLSALGFDFSGSSPARKELSSA